MCTDRYCTHRWYDTNSGTLTYAGRQHALDTTWRAWLVDDAATSTTSQAAWGNWTSAATTTQTMYVTINTLPTVYTNGAYRTPQPTAAELEARDRRRQERLEQDAARMAADKTAEELLMSCLSKEQQAELRLHDYFHVVGARSGRRYCIKRGRAGNVSWRPSLGPAIRYCIHDSAGLPAADTMLGQKLMLETDEDEFLRIANASR